MAVLGKFHRFAVCGLLGLALFLPGLGYAAEAKAEALKDSDRPSHWHCLSDHFSEAVVLNVERKGLYSQISSGATEPISDALLDFEHSLTAGVEPLLPFIKKYWKAGIPILCKGLVPIAETPPFSERFMIPLPPGDPNFVNPFSLVGRLAWKYLIGGREGVMRAGREEIKNLDKPDHYQCMVKHFLESIVATAEVADEVEALAQGSGLPSTYWLSMLSIQSQMFSLFATSKLDRLAEGAHRAGIPILCNDVPIILKEFAPQRAL